MVLRYGGVSFFQTFLYLVLPSQWTTLPETNIAPENRPKPNRKVVFQPSIFRGYVSFREGKTLKPILQQHQASTKCHHDSIPHTDTKTLFQFTHVDVSRQIIHLFIGFSIIFSILVENPIFLGWHPCGCSWFFVTARELNHTSLQPWSMTPLGSRDPISWEEGAAPGGLRFMVPGRWRRI